LGWGIKGKLCGVNDASGAKGNVYEEEGGAGGTRVLKNRQTENDPRKGGRKQKEKRR